MFGRSPCPNLSVFLGLGFGLQQILPEAHLEEEREPIC